MMVEKEQVKTEEKRGSEPVKKEYWKYATIALSFIVFLFFIGKTPPTIHFKYILLIGGVYAMYLGYQYYLHRIRVPSLKEMIKICRTYEADNFIYLNDRTENVLAEPLGQDLYAIRFLEEKRTYILYKNVIIGKSIKDIIELQQDNERNTVSRILAQKGFGEVFNQ